MVRAVPPHRADSGRARGHLRWACDRREDERRREPERSRAFHDPRHPDAPAVQGRTTRRHAGRPRTEGRHRPHDRETSLMADRKVVIIGSGPAGLTAALYTARANLSPLLIEGLDAGGQLMLTTMVDNWPGYRDGIMGPDLMAEMRAQTERFGTEILTGNVTSVDLSRRPFTLAMGDGKKITTESLIIATGASARWLEIGS